MKGRVNTLNFKICGLGHFWLLKSWVLVPFVCRVLKDSLTPTRWMAKSWKDTLPDLHPCILCKYFILFLLLPLFSFYDFDWIDQFGVFWNICMLIHWTIQTKTMRISLRGNNFWKVVWTSVIYLKMMLENFVWKKFTNFNLWVKFIVIIFIFLRCPFSVKEWLKRMSPCHSKLFLKHFWSWIKDSITKFWWGLINMTKYQDFLASPRSAIYKRKTK